MKGIEEKESLKAKGQRHETEFTRGERARPVGRGAKPETLRAKRFNHSTRKEKGETGGRGVRFSLYRRGKE